MANLITNPSFRTALTGWTVVNVTHRPEDGVQTVGCAEMSTTVANAASMLEDTTAVTGSTDYLARLTFSAKMRNGTPSQPLVVTISDTGETELYVNVSQDGSDYVTDEWLNFGYVLRLPHGEAMRVKFAVAAGDAANFWWIDEVEVESLSEVEGDHDDSTGWSLRNLVLRLMRMRRDFGGVKHTFHEYVTAVRRARKEAPKNLWRRDIDTSLTTVDEQVRYSLASISDLDKPEQVLAVWIEDPDEDDDAFFPVGQYHVEDDLGTLTLVFDRDPVEADRTIKLEWLAPPSGLGGEDSETELDASWLIARAMVELLLFADPTREDPNLIAQQMQIWDQKRQAREREVRLGRRPGKYRTTNWRAYQ